MNQQSCTWEEAYLAVTGQLEKETSGDSAIYDRAWQEIYDARGQLCQRFGMSWEDPDLERILNAIVTLEKDVAQRMFLLGAEHRER